MHTMSSFSLPMVEVGSLSATRSMLSFRLDSQPATLSRSAWRLTRRKGVEIISLCFQADLQDHHHHHHHHPLTFAAARRGASIVAWALKTREHVTNNNKKRWICTVASPPMSDVETSQESEESLVENADARDSFVWKSNWYPVYPEIDMDKAVPHGFQILGRKVVIWYDKQLSKWQTFVDMCPHRLAPLSEGRIDEQGCLQCCYHGWSFKGDGSCARIPQAQPEGPEAKATGNKMAHCISFPTVVKQGILFIWPDEYGQELADKTLPPITPGIDEPGWCAVATFRDVDYGFDTLMEKSKPHPSCSSQCEWWHSGKA